jgi:hypothetical protein
MINIFLLSKLMYPQEVFSSERNVFYWNIRDYRVTGKFLLQFHIPTSLEIQFLHLELRYFASEELWFRFQHEYEYEYPHFNEFDDCRKQNFTPKLARSLSRSLVWTQYMMLFYYPFNAELHFFFSLKQCCGWGRFMTGSVFRKRSDPVPDPDIYKFSVNFYRNFFLYMKICSKKYFMNQKVKQQRFLYLWLLHIPKNLEKDNLLRPGSGSATQPWRWI